MERDAVIVGAGPNGLAAAIALAQAGWSVELFEAAETVGGGARSAELTLPGFVHDVCSAIYPLAVGSPFLSRLPLDRHGLRWVHPPFPLAHPFDDGSAAVLARGTKETGESFRESADVRAWDRLFRPLAAAWEGLAPDLLGPLHWPRHPFQMAGFGLRSLRSASGFARVRFRGFRARALFAGLAAHSFLPLEQIPSNAVGLLMGVTGHAVGWPQPVGGAQRIPDAMASLLRETGGTITTGRLVRSVDELPRARAYLFDLTPAQMLRLDGLRWPPRYRRRLDAYRYGPGVFKIDWALSGPIPWKAAECRQAGTVHVGGTLEEIAASERASWTGKEWDRPFVLVGQASLFDPSRAPAGSHTGWAYCHVPHGSTVDKTEVIERQIERFAPGFQELILARHMRNTAQLEAYNPNLVGGDINGGAATLSQLLTRPVARLDPYSTPDRRVFLCSSSTPPTGGVHGMCGYHAAQSALSRRL
ncbi:MAG TPA: NAD(P)/FAD-dependent oxidoreductase [Thermoanaerobaculia bacterium]|jgi:phytoene dehydrogenase-like protein|nr:NAD(P)/FAD-dependent oxidoreductase [Thermoanaerobaculia bacterium]